MTKEILMTNDEKPARRLQGRFVIRASLLIRHSSFVIRHFS